jgi:hypothetical protein
MMKIGFLIAILSVVSAGETLAQQGTATSGATTLTCRFSEFENSFYFDNDGTRPDSGCNAKCMLYNLTGRIRTERSYSTAEVGKGLKAVFQSSPSPFKIHRSEASLTCNPPPPPRPETILIWVKAFIPGNGPAPIANVPNHPGQTMLNGGALGCFLTDQRDFSPVRSTEARLTSNIAFKLSSAELSGITQSHQTGITQKVDCATGNTAGLCRAQATSKGMEFRNIQFDAGQKIASMTLEGSASNPCFDSVMGSPAPNIHYKVQLSFNTNNRTWAVTAVTGQFPAFEAYMQVDSGPVKPLFQLKALNFNLGSAIFLDRVPQVELTGTY